MWETWVWSLGWEDSPGEGKGFPLQYSGLENSIGYIVHGVTELDTTKQLSLLGNKSSASTYLQKSKKWYKWLIYKTEANSLT